MRTLKCTTKTNGSGNKPLPFPERKRTMYRDIETGEAVTIEQLHKEYEQMKQEQPDEYGYSFMDYVHNCLTENNGTLERIEENEH